MNETIRDKVLELHYEIAKLKRKLLHENEQNARIAERTVLGFGTPLQANDPRDRRSLVIASKIRSKYSQDKGLETDD